MSQLVKFGLVGCGMVSQNGVLRHFAREDIRDRVKLVAVMDIVPERAKACMEQFGAEEWYADYDEMLAEADIDAVSIATPTQLHFEQSMKAIAAGKHVHINKTITQTLEDANRLIEARDRAGVKVVACPGRGHRSVFVKTRQVIEEGAIGRVYWASAGTAGPGVDYQAFRTQAETIQRGGALDPTWWFKPGGGPMHNRGVYMLHAMTGVLGPAKRVTGMSGIRVGERTFQDQKITVEQDDNTLLVLDFGDNLFAYMFGSLSIGNGRGGLFFSGSEGRVSVEASMYDPSRIEVRGKVPDGYTVIEVPHELPHIPDAHLQITEAHVFSDLMHLAHCVVNDETPIVSAEHARHVIEIIDKGYRAAQTGQTQLLTTTF